MRGLDDSFLQKRFFLVVRWVRRIQHGFGRRMHVCQLGETMLHVIAPAGRPKPSRCLQIECTMTMALGRKRVGDFYRWTGWCENTTVTARRHPRWRSEIPDTGRKKGLVLSSVRQWPRVGLSDSGLALELDLRDNRHRKQERVGVLIGRVHTVQRILLACVFTRPDVPGDIARILAQGVGRLLQFVRIPIAPQTSDRGIAGEGGALTAVNGWKDLVVAGEVSNVADSMRGRNVREPRFPHGVG